MPVPFNDINNDINLAGTQSSPSFTTTTSSSSSTSIRNRISVALSLPGPVIPQRLLSGRELVVLDQPGGTFTNTLAFPPFILQLPTHGDSTDELAFMYAHVVVYHATHDSALAPPDPSIVTGNIVASLQTFHNGTEKQLFAFTDLVFKREGTFRLGARLLKLPHAGDDQDGQHVLASVISDQPVVISRKEV